MMKILNSQERPYIIIVPDGRAGIGRVRPADVDGRLEVENVGELVPRVHVLDDAVGDRAERAVLRERAVHRRAARTAVQPQEERVGRR